MPQLMSCRCYEIRCHTGVVWGNYSSAGTLYPYPVSMSDLWPVYKFSTSSGTPPVDDFNRSFPGNILNSSDVLFTQCWNASDLPV